MSSADARAAPTRTNGFAGPSTNAQIAPCGPYSRPSTSSRVAARLSGHSTSRSQSSCSAHDACRSTYAISARSGPPTRLQTTSPPTSRSPASRLTSRSALSAARIAEAWTDGSTPKPWKSAASRYAAPGPASASAASAATRRS
ncbi:putative icmF1 [Burkholderia pseudomallei]|nr:putative icmF1 [Burkholderia pseudomallei]